MRSIKEYLNEVLNENQVEKKEIITKIENLKTQIERSNILWKRLYLKEKPLSASGYRHKTDQERRKKELKELKEKLKKENKNG